MRRRTEEEGEDRVSIELKRPRVEFDPEDIWITAPAMDEIMKLENSFSSQNLRAARDMLTVYGWMLDGHTPQGQLDRWTRLFLLTQQIHASRNLSFDKDPIDITQFSQAGKAIFFFTEEDLNNTEHALFRRLLENKSSGDKSADAKKTMTPPSIDIEKLRLLAKASSTIRFYRVCLGALKFQMPVFNPKINSTRVRKAIALVKDQLNPRSNEDYKRDLWSLHLTLGELCVYSQQTCSKFSRDIDVSAIVRRLPGRSNLRLKDEFEPNSPEQQLTDLWCFDLWLKRTCARNPVFVRGNVITWRLHCREDSVGLLISDTLGMRSKPPVIVMLGQDAWVVVDTKQQIWSAFESVIDAIACFLLYSHVFHNSCFSNCMPIPELPD